MKECPHCNQLSLDEDRLVSKCYKCGHEAHALYPLSFEEEIKRLKEEAKKANLTSERSEEYSNSALARREAERIKKGKWAKENKDKINARRRDRAAELRKEKEKRKKGKKHDYENLY